MFSRLNVIFAAACVVAPSLLVSGLVAQQGPAVTRIEAEPAQVVVTVGQAVRLELATFGANGERVPADVSLVGPRAGVDVVSWLQDGMLRGLAPGEYRLVALARAPGSGAEPTQLGIPVTVRWPAIASVEVEAERRDSTSAPRCATTHGRSTQTGRRVRGPRSSGRPPTRRSPRWTASAM